MSRDADTEGVSSPVEAGGMPWDPPDEHVLSSANPFAPLRSSPTPPPLDPGHATPSSFLSAATLANIADTAAHADSSQLYRAVQQLLDHAHASRDINQQQSQKIKDLSSRVAVLTAQVTSLPSMYSLQATTEQDRLIAENELLRRESRALSRKLSQKPAEASASQAHPFEDWAPGTRLLRADCQHLKRKLKESEANASYMETQLLKLRSILISNSPLIVQDLDVLSNAPDDKNSHSYEYPPVIDEALPSIRTTEEMTEDENATTNRKRLPTMGDAEAEHLLLAGKRLGMIRRIMRMPIKHKSYREHSRTSPHHRYALGSPGSPAPEAHGGMDELLHAAQTVLTRNANTTAVPHTKNTTSTSHSPRRSPTAAKRRKLSSMPGITLGHSPESPKSRAYANDRRSGRMDVDQAAYVSDVEEQEGIENDGDTSRENTPVAKELLSTPKANTEFPVDQNRTPRTPRTTPRSIATNDSPNTKQRRMLSGLDVLADQATASQESSGSTRNEVHADTSPSSVAHTPPTTEFGRPLISGLEKPTPHNSLADDDWIHAGRDPQSNPFISSSTNEQVTPSRKRRRSLSLELHDERHDDGHLSHPNFGKPGDQTTATASGGRMQFPNLSPNNNRGGLPPASNPPTKFMRRPSQRSPSAPPSPASPRKAPLVDISSDPNQIRSNGEGDPEDAPTKKGRSPYIKWNLAEDEMLVKAVIEWGQRWDQVSRLVPVRSYHQCRQRWLRGLKGGDQLPDELKGYGPAVQAALRRHEAIRRNASKPPLPLDEINQDNSSIADPGATNAEDMESTDMEPNGLELERVDSANESIVE